MNNAGKRISKCEDGAIWKKVKRMAEIKVPIQVNLPDDWVEQIVNRLRNDPEAEWVEIIRCKDCKHWREGTAFSYCDKLYGMGVLDEDYCSFAERREK